MNGLDPMEGATFPRASIGEWNWLLGRAALLDGRVELLFGLMSLVSSTTSSQLYIRPDVSPPGWTWWLDWLGMAGFLGVAIGGRWLNTHIIFPRSGYVAFPDRPLLRWLPVAALVVGITALGFLRVLPRSDQMGLGCAILFATFLIGVGVWFRLPDWIGLGIFAMAVTAWEFRNSAGNLNYPVVQVCVGSAMVLTGAWRLWRFLRANPIPTDDTP